MAKRRSIVEEASFPCNVSRTWLNEETFREKYSRTFYISGFKLMYSSKSWASGRNYFRKRNCGWEADVFETLEENSKISNVSATMFPRFPLALDHGSDHGVVEHKSCLV